MKILAVSIGFLHNCALIKQQQNFKSSHKEVFFRLSKTRAKKKKNRTRTIINDD